MSVNLIDSSNIEVKQSGSDISLDLGSEVVVDSIRTKNMLDSSTIVQGDITNAYSTLRMSSRQVLWLETGTYTFSTNMSSSYNYVLQIQSVGVPPLSSYPTYIYDSGWQTASPKTFTINTAGWFSLALRRSDNGAFTSTDLTNLKGFNYQLETGSTATTYAPYQNLTPDTSGLDNGHSEESNGYGGFVKRTVRGNQTTYTFSVPNHQNNGFIRSALVMCGDKGFMTIRWAGNNGINPTVAWSSFASSQVSLSHSNGILTIKFASTVYGSVDVLFTN